MLGWVHVALCRGPGLGVLSAQCPHMALRCCDGDPSASPDVGLQRGLKMLCDENPCFQVHSLVPAGRPPTFLAEEVLGSAEFC